MVGSGLLRFDLLWAEFSRSGMRSLASSFVVITFASPLGCLVFLIIIMIRNIINISSAEWPMQIFLINKCVSGSGKEFLLYWKGRRGVRYKYDGTYSVVGLVSFEW